MYKIIPSICVLAALVIGCSGNKQGTASLSGSQSGSLTDITPAPAPIPVAPVSVTPGPSDQPIADATLTTETPLPSPVKASPPAAGQRKYTVRKGDTLWAIAKTNYGDGKQYTKIVAANPGVAPDRLMAGQTLLIP